MELTLDALLDELADNVEVGGLAQRAGLTQEELARKLLGSQGRRLARARLQLARLQGELVTARLGTKALSYLGALLSSDHGKPEVSLKASLGLAELAGVRGGIRSLEPAGKGGGAASGAGKGAIKPEGAVAGGAARSTPEEQALWHRALELAGNLDTPL